MKCSWTEREEEQNWTKGVNSGVAFLREGEKEKIKEGKLSLTITKDVNYNMTGDKKDPWVASNTIGFCSRCYRIPFWNY